MESLDAHVLRPLSEPIHAEERHQELHYDFVVIKDALSRFVELIPCREATPSVVAVMLLDWYKTFGLALNHVSDQDTHFNNQVISELNSLIQNENNFVAACNIHQANGTIEIVNRAILEIWKSLSEFRLSPESRHGVIPLMQTALNHASLPSLGGLAPITVFIGLPAQNLLGVI